MRTTKHMPKCRDCGHAVKLHTKRHGCTHYTHKADWPGYCQCRRHK